MASQGPTSVSKCAHKIRGVKILQNTLLEDQYVTHPPESTGATTRTKGGSKGKLSCTLETERIVLKTLSPLAPPLKTINTYIKLKGTYFIREIEQNVVHPFLFF